MGTKYCGHDSAICLIDTEEKTIFAMSTERVTRIKHDYIDITPILANYKFHQVDYVSHSYNDFRDEGKDGELREKMTFNKDIEKAIRLIIKPQYIKDLRISKLNKNKLILKSLFFNFPSVRDYYAAKIKRAAPIETKTSPIESNCPCIRTSPAINIKPINKLRKPNKRIQNIIPLPYVWLSYYHNNHFIKVKYISN